MINDIRAATKQRAKNRGLEVVKFFDIEVIGSRKNHPEVVSRCADREVFHLN